MKKEKIEKEGKNKSWHLGFVSSNAFGCPHRVYKILKTLAQIEAEKSVTENFVRKKNGQIKGLISHMWLILCYTVQLVITKLCTKFQDPWSSSS